jgi:ribosomal protein S18 acetylase RimI-like enzyme
MVNCSIQNVNDPNLIKEFIVNSGNSIRTFRYFNNRNYDVICNHLVTYLLYDDSGFPIGYGHLEFEGDKIWLGIAISEKFKGCGFGTKMMRKLIEFAREKKVLSIFLTVDVENITAIILYQKCGFLTIDHLSESIQMMRLDLSL